MKLKCGTQIVYVPLHANGDTDHSDCETGFATSFKPGSDTAFCRYCKATPGELRTKANSEATPVDLLIVEDTVRQSLAESALEKWCNTF